MRLPRLLSRKDIERILSICHHCSNFRFKRSRPFSRPSVGAPQSSLRERKKYSIHPRRQFLIILGRDRGYHTDRPNQDPRERADPQERDPAQHGVEVIKIRLSPYFLLSHFPLYFFCFRKIVYLRTRSWKRRLAPNYQVRLIPGCCPSSRHPPCWGQNHLQLDLLKQSSNPRARDSTPLISGCHPVLTHRDDALRARDFDVREIRVCCA